MLQYHAAMYIVDGSGYFEDERTPRREVSPGTCFFCYSGKWHNFDPDPGTTWTEYWVTFDGDAVEQDLGGLLPEEGSLFHATLEPRVVQAYEKLYDFWFYQPTGYREYSFLLLHEILVELSSIAGGLTVSPDRSLLYRTRESMEERLEQPGFDTRGFAGTVNMGYEAFRKEFRRVAGLSPTQYFLMLKINRAKELLIRQDKTVKEVAAELGFDDPFYFSRLFKRKTGMAPAHYKRPGGQNG